MSVCISLVCMSVCISLVCMYFTCLSVCLYVFHLSVCMSVCVSRCATVTSPMPASKLPSPIAHIVQCNNLMYAHERSHFNPEYFRFLSGLLESAAALPKQAPQMELVSDCNPFLLRSSVAWVPSTQSFL